jgi:hypothetical protein
VQFDDALANGQSQSKTIDFPYESGIYTMKPIEDMFEVCDRYPNTRIAYAELPLAHIA